MTHVVFDMQNAFCGKEGSFTNMGADDVFDGWPRDDTEGDAGGLTVTGPEFTAGGSLP